MAQSIPSPGRRYTTIERLQLEGLRDGVLFIPGAEAEGFLVYPQASIMQEHWQTRDDYIRLVTQNGGNIFLCHVEERPDWPTDKLDGLEIYNHHTDVKDEGAFLS